MKIDGKQIDGSLTNKDKLLGSAFTSTVNGVDQFVTRNFTLESIKDFVSGSVATEAIALKTNGGLVREGVNNELAIDLGASSITGQLANADLANSSITINSTAVSLGGSITLNTDNIAEGSSNQYFTNARSRSAISVTGGGASYNSSTGVITLPAYFTLATGNVTNASVSGQTLTLTRQSTTDVTFTPTANDFTDADHSKLDGIEASADVTDTANVVAALTAGTNITIAGDGTISSTDTNTQLTTEQVQDIVGAMFTGNTETRISADYQDGDGTIDLVVDDMTANTQNTTTLSFVDSTNDVILRNTTGGASSGTQDIKFVAGSNVTLTPSGSNMTIASQAFGTVHTVASESAMISATSTGGDIVIRTDVSKTFIHNGGSAGTVADFSELQFSGINNLALTAGDGIDLSRTTVTNTNNDLTITNSLATTTERGGIKIGYTENGKNYPVELSSEKAYVNVPWTDTDTNTFRTVQADGSAIGATETLNLIGGTNVTLSESNGAITIAATDTDTNTFRTVTAGGNTLGASETLAFTAGSNITISEDAGAVTIASTDTNTQRSDEDIRDVIVSMLTAGSNITLNEDDAANTLTITSTDTNDNTFRTVTVDTDGNGSADNTLGATENLMLKKGGGINLAESSGVVTISHTDTSSQASVDNSGRTYIQDITLDTYGHVTGITSATETVVDTNTNQLTEWTLTDDDDDNTTISHGKHVKFVMATGALSTNTTGTGTDSDPFLVTLTSPDNNTTYTAGHGLTLSGTEFQWNYGIETTTVTGSINSISTTSGRYYAIQADDQDRGELVVNVPWTDTQLSTADVRSKISASGLLTYSSSTGVISTTAQLTATATELNILDGATVTTQELNRIDGFIGDATDLNYAKELYDTGVTATEFNTALDGITASASELNFLDGSTAGTVVASKAVVVDSNKDVTGFRNITLTGTLTTPTLGSQGNIEIDNASPLLILNDTTVNSTSTNYTPSILFRADDVNKAVIGKKSGSENIFHVENYDGPLTVSGMQDSKTISAECAHEPANTSGHYGLKLHDSSTQSHSLYIGPSAFNNQSSLFFNGTTNALNVSRISHNNSLGTLLFDVPDDGTSSLSVKFRQYNTGGYMQNMIDFEDDGDIRNINGTYGTIVSDRRAKENIVDATPKLDDILSLQVKNFNLIGSNKKHIGLIAQDVEQVFPSWVDTKDTRIYKTYDENGILLEEQGELVSGYEDGKSLKVGMEFAVLVKTIQELNAKIEGLEQRIQTLENN